MTLEEAWSGQRLVVDHFKIFGCVAYAHIPNQKRTKKMLAWISNDVVEQQIPTNFDGVDEEERQQPTKTDQQIPLENVVDASGSPVMASDDE
ncbi:hypothetical protein CR513_04540, partial [Mucuna pruriens]